MALDRLVGEKKPLILARTDHKSILTWIIHSFAVVLIDQQRNVLFILPEILDSRNVTRQKHPYGPTASTHRQAILWIIADSVRIFGWTNASTPLSENRSKLLSCNGLLRCNALTDESNM